MRQIIWRCITDSMDRLVHSGRVSSVSAKLEPFFWIRYVDDTFTLWPHGKATLDDVLIHLNSLRPTIKFTVEVESGNMLPFLDVRVTRDLSTLMTRLEVCHKPTHSDRYLNFRSYHPHSTKHGIICTLVHLVETICTRSCISIRVNDCKE